MNYSRMLSGLIALGLTICPRPLQGQTITFVRQFGTSSLDIARGVGMDSTGVYVAGYRSGSGSMSAPTATSGWEVTLRKYDTGGNEQWTQDLGPPINGLINPMGVATDATGVYIAGDGFLRKVDTGGNELWTRQFGTSRFELATGAALDATGVYVVGNSGGGAILRKYDAAGNELWTQPVGPAPSIGPVVAADATGVYVAGSSADEPFVRKYDAGGNTQWTRPFGNIGLVFGVAVDGAGVYAVGNLCCDGTAFVRKYDTRGNEQWTRRFGQLSSEVPQGVTVDATGLYVAGTTRRALPGQCYGGNGDAFVRKYDARGNELWTRQFGTWASEEASGAAVDSTGVYVIGRRDDWFHPDHSNSFLAKLEKTPAVVGDSKPRIIDECILNAASYIGGGVAPGEIVTILGSAMGPPESTPLQVTTEGRLATTLADTRILFNGVAAPLVYVSGQQSSAIVPFGVAGSQSVDVQVEYQGMRSDAVTVPVLDVRLGVFTLDASGGGPAAIVNQDGSINSPSHPAPAGSVVAIYATGGGQTDPPGTDGTIAGDTLSRLKLSLGIDYVTLTDSYAEYCGGVGGLICAEVLYAGSVPGSVAGLVQINARIPVDAPPGNAVTLHVSTEQSITIAIR